MDFKQAAILGQYLSKDYAESIFGLLVSYHNISASEAASRLSLHIRTVQGFLEAMYSLDILEKEEVYEKKRPYFRYRLKKMKISMEIDLNTLLSNQSANNELSLKIRESKNSGAKFSTARNGPYFSNISIWIGEGREVKERKINLTVAQGTFLYNLPFPGAEFKSISEIMKLASINEQHVSEIIDIVKVLRDFKVIESLDI
jgi:predicted transcriptional regulator